MLDVEAREKPSDYVYTETEIKNYDALEKRIKALEENGFRGAVMDAIIAAYRRGTELGK